MQSINQKVVLAIGQSIKNYIGQDIATDWRIWKLLYISIVALGFLYVEGISTTNSAKSLGNSSIGLVELVDKRNFALSDQHGLPNFILFRSIVRKLAMSSQIYQINFAH